MNGKLRILFLEDKLSDAKLTELELKKAKIDFVSKRVETEKDFIEAFSDFKPDLILADYNLPSYDGLSAMRYCVEKYPEMPIIIVTGSLDEETAVQTMKAGAWDYVIKDNLLRLVPAIKNALKLKAEKAEKNAAERKSHEKELKYRLVVKNSLLGIYISQQNIIKFCNNTFARIFGYEDYTELVDKSVKTLIAPESWDTVVKNVQIRESGKDELAQYFFKGKKKDGSIIHLETLGSKIEFEGKPAIQGTLRDITRQKEDERKLIESEQRFRMITEKADDLIGISSLKVNSKIMYVSPSYERVLGYKSEDLLGTNTFEIVHPEDKKRILPVIKRYIENKVKKLLNFKTQIYSEKFEFRVKDIYENWRFIETTATLLNEESVLLISRDVTQRKRTEQLLKDNENRFRILSEAPFEAIFFSEKGICIDQNKTAEKMFGYSLEEAVGRAGVDWIAPVDRKMVMENIMKANEEPYEALALRKDGSTFPAEIKGRMTLREGKKVRITALSDISRQKDAEEALRENETRLRSIVDDQTELICRFDVNKKIDFINKAFCLLLGKTEDELIGTSLKQYIEAEVVQKNNVEFKKINPNQDHLNHVHDIIINGKRITCEWTDRILFDEKGEISGYQSVGRDITKNVENEINLQKSEHELRSLFNAMNDLVFEIDNEGRYINIAPTNPKLMFKPPNELLGKTMHDVFPEAEADSFLNFVRRSLEEKRKILIEYPMKIKNKTYWFEGSAIPKTENSVLYMAHDITHRKKTEQDLKHMQEYNQNIIESSMDMIISVDNERRIVEFNNAAVQNFGYSKDEVIGKDVSMLYYKSKAGDSVHKITESDEHFKGEVLNVRKNGSLFPVFVSSSVLRNNEGMKIGVMGISHDISKRKQDEKELREKNSLLDNILNRAGNIGIITTDKDFRVTTYNPMAEKFFGIPTEQVLKKYVKDVHPKLGLQNERFNKGIKSVNETGEHHFELTQKTEIGELILSCRVTKIVDEDGLQVGYSLFSMDVTERVKAEQQIKDDLEEKKVLLKEVHHRVKNNMQIISSLLRMQTRFIKDPDDMQCFKDSLRRVQTMAIVHEKLYQSENLARINLYHYIKKLSDNLVSSISRNSNLISIEIEMNDLYFDINMAIPFGLIINEIMSNSLKYAFKEDQKGLIKIALTQTDGIYKLEISDDGVGISSDIDLKEASTLGLQLVSALANQLKAECEVNNKNGTHYTLSFADVELKTYRKF